VGPLGGSTAASGIAFDGTNMWVTRKGCNDVTKLSPSGAKLGTFPVGPTPTGLAFDGARMWATRSGAVVEL